VAIGKNITPMLLGGDAKGVNRYIPNPTTEDTVAFGTSSCWSIFSDSAEGIQHSVTLFHHCVLCLSGSTAHSYHKKPGKSVLRHAELILPVLRKSVRADGVTLVSNLIMDFSL